jgi:hypothetical protein
MERSKRVKKSYRRKMVRMTDLTRKDRMRRSPERTVDLRGRLSLLSEEEEASRARLDRPQRLLLRRPLSVSRPP